ncbi:hypothetical protein TRVA0_022S01156 [Trichomonascus vanleenenianus]|uniref:Bbc1p n=1 Tax=Trichomonascus vanleenenianus TaxID=2268995 RepID=UPI003ECA5BAB
MSVPALPFLVKALYPYTSDHPDDLPFSEGDVIKVDAVEGDDWYSGSLAAHPDKRGMFPKNFVEVQEPQEESAVEPVEHEPEPAKPAEPEPVGEPGPVKLVKPEPVKPDEPATEAIEPTEQMLKLSLENKPEPKEEKPPKPPKSNAFKDRIAAFNAMNDAPPTPQFQQPKQRSFVNKPYVPPPSSYVPAAPKSPPAQPKPSFAAPPPVPHAAEPAELVHKETEEEEEEAMPKMSLKERIAMLQKQQEEEHVRSEAAAQRKKARADAKRKALEEQKISKDSADGEEERRLSVDKTGESVTSHRRSSSSAKRLSVDFGRRASQDTHEEQVRRGSLPAKPEEADSDIEEVAHQREARKSIDERARSEEEDEDEDEDEEEDEEDESSEEDEEEAKRIALRERMAKISAGGMGMSMGGMGMMIPGFGAPMAPASAPKKRRKSKKKEEENEEENEDEESRQAPVPIMPFADPSALKNMGGGKRHDSDEEEENVEASPSPTSSPVSERAPTSPISERAPPPAPAPPARQAPPAPPGPTSPISEEAHTRAPPPLPPSIPHASHPGEPGDSRHNAPPPPPGAPPVPDESPASPTSERSVPPLPLAAPVPPVPAPPAESQQVKRMSTHGERLPPPPPPAQAAPPHPSDVPSLPPILKDSFDPFDANKSDDETVESEFGDDERTESDLASEPKSLTKRDSYVAGAPRPPIPNVSQHVRRSSTHYDTYPTVSERRSLERAHTTPLSPTLPPPPPPPQPPMPNLQKRPEEETEVTGYDADEDTDMNPNVSVDEGYHGPPYPPHPPVIQPPLPPKESIGRPMPPFPSMRAPPPPVPSSYSVDGPLEGDEQTDTTEDDTTSPGTARIASPPPPVAPPPPPHPHQAAPAATVAPPRSVTPTSRQSVDYSRPHRSSQDLSRTMSTRHRQSVDRGRTSVEGSGLSTAHVLDYGVESGWWAQPNAPPPAVSNNLRNVIYEVEDNKTPKRGGKTLVVRDVYILYHDLSQTVLTARFEEHDPLNTVSFEQEHSQPPAENQDRLEDAYRRYGTKILEAAQTALGQTLPPNEFVSQVVRSVEGAIPPIGSRSYGAVIYSNLSNASVKQWDEIRPGDVIAFRNAKFQGHKGGLHQKYTAEAGRGDGIHAGIVYEWDGSKRKVRIFEQNPDKNKVKQESYRLNDLKSGEVKAFRIIGREYVGWD